MKLDPAGLRYMTRDDFRVLTAVEMGMKNHDLVPIELVAQIAGLRLGGVGKVMSTLLRMKLLHHDRTTFDGYRLTYLGYDFLALRVMLARGNVAGVGRQIGVGKESDIFLVVNEEGEEMCLKLHRLGRTSFRAVKNKRDYHSHRGSPSWLYLSRLAAMKENAFMKVLREHGFPTPLPIDANRHCILMSLVDGFPLNQCKKMEDPAPVYIEMMQMVERFARHGLIHGDFNEFNVMINGKGVLTVIDFPQMVSIKHPNARMYFERDVNCVRRFFRKRYDFTMDVDVSFDECLANRTHSLDVLVAASGFSFKMAKELDRFVLERPTDDDDDDDDESEIDGEGEEARLAARDAVQAGPVDAQVEDVAAAAGADTDAAAGAAGPAAPPAAPAAPAAAIAPSVGAEEDKEKFKLEATGKESEETTGASTGTTKELSQSSHKNEEFEMLSVAGGLEDDEAASAATGTSAYDDSPMAYMRHDYASQASAQPRLDDIRRRVRRDQTKKAKRAKATSHSGRNTVKNKEKKQMHRDMNDPFWG